MTVQGYQSDTPFLSRDPNYQLPGDLPRGSELPADHDPLADGILMDHQIEWIEDDSDLKIGEKGRRTGLTYAEALDDTITAAKSRSAGGDNVFYIGDTKDKGREFIGYVKHFALVVSKELVSIEEFLFEDQLADGTTKLISAYRAQFASGFRVEALSSRPENIRGLQGIVVIDEAAYHKDVRAVLDAVNALLIWGGKVRVISTHNGVLNAFNELIREARAGRNPFKVHFIPFSLAVKNGLYKRVCYVKGIEYTPEGEIEWEKNIRASYGSRQDAMRQELDAIPAETEGAALTRVQIERCMAKPGEIPTVKFICNDAFKNLPEEVRKAKALKFCEDELLPLLNNLDQDRQHVFGSDFARKGDAADFVPLEIGTDLVRRAKFLLEMRNVPFDQQRDILFYAVERLPRMAGGALDATGNGAYIAESMALKFGSNIVEVHLSQAWYQDNAPPYVEAFGDGTILLNRSEDVLKDHQALAYVNGIIKVPDGHRFKGEDGFDRHGDSAIAYMLAWFASRQDFEEIAYQSVPIPAGKYDEAPTGAAGGWHLFGEPAARGLGALFKKGRGW